MNNPLISIIIPCYNQSNFLSETLQSVLNQTYAHWECLLVNDGSTDDSHKVALKWGKSDKRFLYFKKENGGLSSARNFGLLKATGDYIQFLDADDLLMPDKFEKQLEDLQNCDISISDYFSFLENDTMKSVPNRYLSPFLSELEFKKEIILDWEYRKSIPCHSVLFKRSLLEKHQLVFDESLPNHEDWVFWSKLFYHAISIKNNKNVLALYRIHEKAMSTDFKLMKQGFLKAAVILIHFFETEKNKELEKLSKMKYKEISKKGQEPLFKKIKTKLVYIYRYVKKN